MIQAGRRLGKAGSLQILPKVSMIAGSRVNRRRTSACSCWIWHTVIETTSVESLNSTAIEDPVLEVEDLNTHIFLKEGVARVVNGVSFQIARGAVLGLVGESGSGKTMTALSILGVVPFPGEVVSGAVKLNGRDLLTISTEELRKVRGERDLHHLPGRGCVPESRDLDRQPDGRGDHRPPGRDQERC